MLWLQAARFTRQVAIQGVDTIARKFGTAENIHRHTQTENRPGGFVNPNHERRI